MRGAVAAVYFMAIGWYVRWSGLDEELARLARDCYDLTVLHTQKVIRDGRDGRDPAALGDTPVNDKKLESGVAS
jgi:hypothetical protein